MRFFKKEMAKDYMRVNTPIADMTDTVDLIASKMHRTGNDIVYITNGDKRLIGAVTAKQLISRVILHSLNPKLVKAKDVMKYFPMTVSADDSALSVRRLFKEFNIRSLPVEKDGKLVGMLKKEDLIAA